MVAALTSAFVVLGKNKALILGFCLNHEVAILTVENFLDFGIKILQSFSDTLDFVGGNATRFEFGPDEFMKLFGGELLFGKPQSGFPALWNFLLLSCQVDQMLKSAQLWQLELFREELVNIQPIEIDFFQDGERGEDVLVSVEVDWDSLLLSDEHCFSFIELRWVSIWLEKVVNIFIHQLEIYLFR